MSQIVTINKRLRSLTGGLETLEVQGATVNDIFNQLEERFPGFRDKLCVGDGELHRFIKVSVDGFDIRYLNSLQTNLKDQSKVLIGTAIAGK